MKKHVIQITLNEQSINRAISDIQAYRDDIARKANKLTEKLAKLGMQDAQIRFTTASYDGTNDSTVSVEPMANGWKVVAKGEAICFIEFGAGVYYNASDSYPTLKPEGIVGIGEYGKGFGKRQAWGYYGDPGTNGKTYTTKSGKTSVITHGNPASMPMWYASQKITQDVLQVAKEVFG